MASAWRIASQSLRKAVWRDISRSLLERTTAAQLLHDSAGPARRPADGLARVMVAAGRGPRAQTSRLHSAYW